ncbi:bifunctional aspartokinase/homoserine dehydrogenase 1 [Pyrus ussuriensis x Pyrus communis]|uniref:Bifunctional aspartokinase/homoserine dehydrogenase 1 n=1 Tax=Pyrus ussuriensis x Pyrus communis TaxID=2448454 RepID=A0A5N5HVK0_9ROSA|nr:bifunctional aspartokinase/homoserine dehydrogenase 1 [Pyrus ussuriensis x Pyrus communis]
MGGCCYRVVPRIQVSILGTSRTGLAGVPGADSDVFSAVKDVGANVIMISQVMSSSEFVFMLYAEGSESCFSVTAV